MHRLPCILLFPLVGWLLAAGAVQAQGAATLVWADEFDREGLPDSTRWGYDVGNGCPAICGWGNNEKEFYTFRRAENAQCKGGKLLIVAKKEAVEDMGYTSARLFSKTSWCYGRMEIRAKLPAGKGTWPAIWMLPTDWAYGGWPKSGEIDIMEHVGHAPDKIFGTVHTEAYNHMHGTQRGDSVVNKRIESGFHAYAIDWSAERIDFFVDETLFFTFKKEAGGHAAWPFDKPFHMMLNLAVGGNWGGKMGINDAVFPQTLEIDYVRVYAPR